MVISISSKIFYSVSTRHIHTIPYIVVFQGKASENMNNGIINCMGLFQKKVLPIVAPIYSLGHQEVRLVVGLGNIGKEFAYTRHNAGFMALDYLAEREQFNGWVEKKDLKSVLCAKLIDGQKVILCKPTTMMNLSGQAVQAVQKFYKISEANTCVVYDEIDLEYGVIRTGAGGQSAGHNGVKSLIAHSDNGFWRIRVGIGPKSHAQMDSSDHVLQNFSTDQSKTLPKILSETSLLIQEWLTNQSKPDTRKIV
jgi:peptidyl-tRNA hydrolase, PTH1 family